MREPKPIPGSRAPLFMRLADPDPLEESESCPLRVLDREAQLKCIRRNVASILSTRRRPRFDEGRQLTVLSYGIPDFSARNAVKEADRQQLAALVAQAIETFETRLRNVRVSFEPNKANPARLDGMMDAELVTESLREPVSFPINLTGEEEEPELSQ